MVTVTLRADGQLLRADTYTAVPQRSGKFDASAAQRRDPVAFFIVGVLTMPVRAQWQQRWAF